MNQMHILKSIKSKITIQCQNRIVKFIEGFEEQSEKFLIFEKLEGNLFHQSISTTDILDILFDISLVLSELHSLGYAHLDIRPGKSDKKIFYFDLKQKQAKFHSRRD